MMYGPAVSSSHRCHQMQREPNQATAKPRQWKSMLIHQGEFIVLLLLTSPVTELERIVDYFHSKMPIV